MFARRALASFGTTAVAGMGIVAFAAPSSAETTVTVSGSVTEVGSEWVGATFSPSAAFGPTVVIDVAGLTGDGDWDEDIYVEGLLTYFDGERTRICNPELEVDTCMISTDDPPQTFNVDPSAANAVITLRQSNFPDYFPLAGNFTVTYAVPSTGSGHTGSGSVFVTLQVLDSADGSWARALEAGLIAWEKTVPVNTWQPLPESSDVVGIDEDEGKVFLGVATTPDFPVDLAQRQVDNGWGAYDMYDDEGALESVFIPAGGSMFVWTQPRLYAVWGSPPS